MNLESWLESEIGFEIPKPGLERIKSAIKAFGLDFSSKTVVTIGGTNGKGQTSRVFYSMAQRAGKAALWTSPHLVSVCERFSKDGRIVDSGELGEIFKRTKASLDSHSLKLSYYEFLFLAFLIYASDCDILVLEVGLGGKFDAVNALDADYVCLTSISRDHQEYLGPRYDGILGEKIALARAGKTLFTNFESSYLRRLSRDYCLQNGVERQDLFELGLVEASDHFGIRNQKLAAHCANKALGLKLEVPVENPGALVEFRYGGALCHGLTAHNPDGVRKGVQFLNHAKYTNFYKLVLLSFSNRRLDDAMTMIKTLKLWSANSLAGGELVITSFSHPKAMDQLDVKELAQKARLKFVDDAKIDIQKYVTDQDRAQILVLGSNYFIGSLCAEEGVVPRR